MRALTQIVMLHDRVRSRFQYGRHCHEDISVSPAILADISARTLLSAITTRCPWFLKLPRGRSLFVMILWSDSAPALLSVAKHYCAVAGGNPYMLFIHALCFMHKLWGAFAATIEHLQVMNLMFCSTCLTHRPGLMHKNRMSCRQLVEAKLVVVWTAPRPQDILRSRKVI